MRTVDIAAPHRQMSSLLRIRSGGRHRLIVCFHPAGAGASIFAGWPAQAELDADLALVQLKGREDRNAEPLDDTLPALANAIADELQLAGHRHLVLVGHSMGGTVAWWVAHALWQRYGRRCLLVISAQAPGVLAAAEIWRAGNLRDWYAKLGEPWPEALDAPELQALVIATLDADIAWMRKEALRPLPNSLPFAIHGLCWESDPLVRAQDMRGWQAWTTEPFSLYMLPGAHLELCVRPGPALKLVRRLSEQESFRAS